MRLGAEVIDFVGLNFVDDSGEVRAIGQVTVVESEFRVDLARWLVDVVDSFGIERGGAAFDPVDFVALFKQEFGKVRAVLSCDSGDKGFL